VPLIPIVEIHEGDPSTNLPEFFLSGVSQTGMTTTRFALWKRIYPAFTISSANIQGKGLVEPISVVVIVNSVSSTQLIKIKWNG
jgi:hypothetical protein